MSDKKINSILELTKKLIALPSITPNDAGCQSLIISRLQNIGFNCEILIRDEVTNLWANRGTNSPLIVFAGHTDVVPPGSYEDWKTDPFMPTENNGRLYGRGSSDMKSSIASFIVAIEEFVLKYPCHPGSIGILLTSDEEGHAINGTKKVCDFLKEKGIRLDYCIVGEPTSDKILGDMCKNGRRGSLSGHLIVKGIQGHIAYSHLALNPIHQLLPAITELTSVKWDKNEDNLPFPPTTFQISNIKSGTGATNIIPDKVEMQFNFRFSQKSTPESLKKRVHAILDQYNLKYNLIWELNSKPFLTQSGLLSKALSDAICSEMNLKTKLSTTGGTSDARFIREICSQVIEFGPKNNMIHKMNEYVEIEVLEPLKNIYKRTLENILHNR